MFKNLNEKDKKKIYTLLSLVVVCAIALIAMPSLSPKDNKEKEVVKKNEPETTSSSNQEKNLESKLKEILSKIEGAGEVDIMITFESSEEIQPAYNSNSTTEKTEEKDTKGGERTITTSSDNKTIITSGSNEPIVLKTNEASIKGVIVVSSGASDPTVKETLYDAVQTALQVAGHQVEVYTK
ncbi:stage III sporulation protein AG [Romboutsia sp. 1001216sp1]|uniref:stage III sporulation protein AG n=1 Tax=unclassified Romboutsia TaxID=2626894 RepID=UPI0018A0ECED|nr:MULTISPECIES: stage III sporulation protein AG [unclassified Romboutsia]MDB8801895.1 stage III sporulation protein AG [Romboutsia sp. 1001216sp1]MDB8813292.1 stage III sporulation protein AG [Romboutsia sp. 1001216sp1]